LWVTKTYAESISGKERKGVVLTHRKPSIERLSGGGVTDASNNAGVVYAVTSCVLVTVTATLFVDTTVEVIVTASVLVTTPGTVVVNKSVSVTV
jgi:hypothetical protein